jgi:hypothetical protein
LAGWGVTHTPTSSQKALGLSFFSQTETISLSFAL